MSECECGWLGVRVDVQVLLVFYTHTHTHTHTPPLRLALCNTKNARAYKFVRVWFLYARITYVLHKYLGMYLYDVDI